MREMVAFVGHSAKTGGVADSGFPFPNEASQRMSVRPQLRYDLAAWRPRCVESISIGLSNRNSRVLDDVVVDGTMAKGSPATSKAKASDRRKSLRLMPKVSKFRTLRKCS